MMRFLITQVFTGQGPKPKRKRPKPEMFFEIPRERQGAFRVRGGGRPFLAALMGARVKSRIRRAVSGGGAWGPQGSGAHGDVERVLCAGVGEVGEGVGEADGAGLAEDEPDEAEGWLKLLEADDDVAAKPRVAGAADAREDGLEDLARGG